MLFLLFSVLALAAPAPIVVVPGGKITVAFEKFPRAAADPQIVAFIERSSIPVSQYYGHFPVKKLRVDVKENSRDEQGLFGREFHGTHISFYLGRSAGADRMKDAQILTHEMFHLGFPDLERKYAWVEEGLATYLAHLNRARAGQTTEEEFWAEAVDAFHDVMAGSGGLASEEYYRRIYWGGALFWFSLDLRIREKTAGKKCLDTVTRALLAGGGTNAHRWTLDRLAKAVDRAAGFAVFRPEYEKYSSKGPDMDVAAMWKNLGVVPSGKTVTLVDDAPMADTRKALLKNMP